MTRDLRKYSRQTNLLLIIGGLFLLFVIGDGLIYLFYGLHAAMLGLLCLLGGMIPVVLVVLIILFLDWISKHALRN